MNVIEKSSRMQTAGNEGARIREQRAGSKYFPAGGGRCGSWPPMRASSRGEAFVDEEPLQKREVSVYAGFDRRGACVEALYPISKPRARRRRRGCARASRVKKATRKTSGVQ